MAGALLALGAALPLALGRPEGVPLAFHLAAEYVLLAAGALVAVLRLPAARPVPVLRELAGRRPLATVVGAVALLVVWHAPPAFAAAEAGAGAHGLMHASFVAAGLGLGAAVPALGPLTRAMVLIWGEAVMMVLALAMVTGAVRYPGYPASQNAVAGITMMVAMQLLWVVLPLGWRLSAVRRCAT